MSDDLREQIRTYANLCARSSGAIPAADVAWKLRQILADPNTGVPDAEATTGAEVRLHTVQSAKRRLYARIIASAHLLDVPFSNAAELSPWALLKRDMAALDEAIAKRDAP